MNSAQLKTALKDYYILAVKEYDHGAGITLAFDQQRLTDNDVDYEDFLNAVISATGGTISNLCRAEKEIWNDDCPSDIISGDIWNVLIIDLKL